MIPKKPSHKKGALGIFKELAPIVKRVLSPHKEILLAVAFFSLVVAASDAFIPFFAGRFFDGLILLAGKGVSPAVILPSLGMWLVLKIFSDILSWRIDRKQGVLGADIESEYVYGAFSRLLEKPLEFHKKSKGGELQQRIHRANEFLDVLTGVLISFAPSFVSIVAAVALSFFIHPGVAAVMVAAVGVYLVFLRFLAPKLAPLQKKMIHDYNVAYGDSGDAISNVKEIKQLATEPYESRRIFKRFVLGTAKSWVAIHRLWAGLGFSQRVLVTATQLTIFVYSLLLIKSGALTPGELVTLNAYAAMLFAPFVQLGMQWQRIHNGAISIIEAEKVFGSLPEIYIPENAVILKGLRGDVVFKNVFFGYKGGRGVLKEISFSVGAGERVALVGESGVGKTTIIDLLMAFYFPKKGRVLVDGHDIRKLDLRAYRGFLGVVPQEVTLFNDTVLNNIRYGSFGKSEEAVKNAAKLAHAHEFIEAFKKKYKQTVGWRGIKLSMGQKQRIAIARAILRDPRILILDEPTSALDASSENLIQESLKELMNGRTTFIIAHRLSTVREADKIIVLDKGRIVEQGRHEDLIKIEKGVYKKLYDLQFGRRAK
ncbi:MAG: ABC transporter ATP-binding protein [Candidatus Niyogibacteria bacterium]|nr:ABC transporter ATP-binding protein [Candidatus Niyogibacteria bacterium]